MKKKTCEYKVGMKIWHYGQDHTTYFSCVSLFGGDLSSKQPLRLMA